MTNHTSNGHHLDTFYRALHRPGITRPTRGRWFTGVAAGIATRLGVDPMVVRLVFVLGALFFGVGVAAYLVLWLLLPAEDGTLRIERALRDGDVPSILLLVAATLSVVGPSVPFGFGGFHGFGLIAVVAVVVWALSRKGSAGRWHANPPAQPGPDDWRVEPTTPVPDDAPRG